MEKWIDKQAVKAVLWAGLPGQESGNAIVDVLWGTVNPVRDVSPVLWVGLLTAILQSAKLPFTIGKKRTDYAADVLYQSGDPVPQVTYSEGLDIDYRHFDSKGIEVSASSSSGSRRD